MTEITVIACGTKGDVLPLLTLGSALLRRGNRIVVLANQHHAAECQRMGLRAEFLDTMEEGEQMLGDLPDLDSAFGTRRYLEKHILPRLSTAARMLEKMHANSRFHLLASAFFGLSFLIAEKFGVTLTTIFESPDHLYRWQTSVEFLVAAMPKKINSRCTELGIAPLHSTADLSRYPQQRIALWPEWFDQNPKARQEALRTGFIVPSGIERTELPQEVQTLLEKTSKPVLITGSTGRSPNARKFYELSIAACQALGLEAIVVCKYRDLLPDPLPAGIIATPWLSPIAAVLQQAAAVVHHGGMGTTSAAITAGVPQLLLADGFDRPTNGRCVQRLGAGKVLLPQCWAEQEVTEALSSVIGQPEMRERCHSWRRWPAQPMQSM